jgi:cytoskeleton-associated protein 5
LSEFDKVEGTPPPVPSRTSSDVPNIPASSSSKAVVGDSLEELFPRVELDSLLKGTTILADAKSESWKTKKEALEALQSILDQGQNKRLKPGLGESPSTRRGTSLTFRIGEIGQVLKARVTDTNKAVQTLALDIVSRIATGMGKPFEKQTKLFTLPTATVLSDQKAPIRAATLQTLTVIATACNGLDSMVPGLATALETTNPVQKSNLLQWLASWFNEHEPPASLDITAFTAPIVASLDDRNSDVRKNAQAMLPVLISCAGFDHVMQQTNSLKPASRASAVPLIQAARPAVSAAPTVPSAGSVETTGATNTPAVTESPPSSPLATHATLPAAGKLTGIRRKLPQGPPSMPESRAETPADAATARAPSKSGVGVKKSGGNSQSSLEPSSQSTPVGSRLPFSGANVTAKKTRLSKDGQRWINEAGTTRKDLAEILQHQMEPHASKELISLLFSHDHNAVNDHIAGLAMICDFFTSAEAGDNAYGLPSADMADICLVNFDLPLKYVSIKAHEPQTNLISKCLDTVEVILTFLRSVNYQLTDTEALCFIPTVIFKVIVIPTSSFLDMTKLSSLGIHANRQESESKVLSKAYQKFTLTAAFSSYCWNMV